jgi:hypothetical protein
MNRPNLIHEIRLGAVCASIWEAANFDEPKYRVSISRLSRRGDRLERDDHFTAEDLPLVAEVVDLAHLWICEQAELIA